MAVVTLLFFDSGRADAPVNPGAMIVLGILAGGDGLADIVGRRYGGSSRLPIGDRRKSLVGSLAMFVGGWLFAFALLTLFSIGTLLDPIACIPLLVGAAALATVVEAFSRAGTDNLTVSFAVLIAFMIVFYAAPEYWSTPLLFTI